MAIRLASFAVACLCAGMANAATINVSNLSSNPSAYANFLASIPPTNRVIEDFEDEGAGLGAVSGVEYPGDVSTSVGTFSRVGGTGSGGTVSNSTFANSGNGLALRSGNVYGRENTTSGGSWFLDSNDTLGMSLLVNPGASFTKIGFTMMDMADVGATFEILVNNVVHYTANSLSNGAKYFFEIDFGAEMAADSVTLLFRNNRLNDGFSIDDVAIAATPIPGSAVLLLGAMGGLAAVRRRKQKAATA